MKTDYTAEIAAGEAVVAQAESAGLVDCGVEEWAGAGGKLNDEDIEGLRGWATRVAKMPAGEREEARQAKIAILRGLYSAPARLVDAFLSQVTATRNAGQSTPQRGTLRFDDPEPWPEAVDAEALLDDVAAAFRRFVALPEGGAETLALWVLMTYCYDAFTVCPMLALLSAVKRSGKTTALSVANALVSRPLSASNITPAALFRSIEKFHPTLLLDEADSFLGQNEEMRGILNAGHTRTSAYVIRTVGDNFEPTQFDLWCPKMIAGIGKLAATLEDRSIIIPARRRAPGEQVERLRQDRLSSLEPLRRQCRRWADDHAAALSQADPEVPDLSSDRASDNWRPLIALASAAGGEWPDRARRAAIVLSGRIEESDGASVTLLEDLRGLFLARGADKLPSDELVRALEAMEERPWPEWSRGKPITARQVAKLLRGFDIKPKTIRVGDRTPRGYEVDQFGDAWERYLPAFPVESATSATSLQNGTIGSATRTKPVAEEKPAISSNVADVADAASGPRGPARPPIPEDVEVFEC